MLVVLGLLTLAGCGVGVQTQRAGGSVMMAIASKPGGVQLAIFEGTLMRTDQGCLAGQISNGQTLVLQFPYGSTLAQDGQSVAVPGVGTVRLGDSFSAGGGAGDLAALSGVPDECQGSASFFSWQGGGAVLP